jgi:tRNA threonylcarbamoyladenosine biosynthesis protein TsaE
LPETIITHSAQETRRWGEELAKQLQSGDVVALIGELGAGKTVLAQGILKGLGVKETVQSPSFIMVREYTGHSPVAHIDLYRLRNSQDFLALGLDEYMDSKYIIVVEWGEKILDILPPHHRQIRLTWGRDHPDQRFISYQQHSKGK